MAVDHSENNLLCTIQVPFEKYFEPLGFHLDIPDTLRDRKQAKIFGYTVDTRSPAWCYITNEHLKLLVFHGHSVISIRLFPLCLDIKDIEGYKYKPLNNLLHTDSHNFYIYSFEAIEVIMPSISEIERYPRNVYYLEPELNRQFSLVCDNLPGILNGSRDDWQRILYHLNYENDIEKTGNEEHSSYLKRLQMTATEAYLKHEYHRAVRYYNALKHNGHLSLRDRFRYRDAYSNIVLYD